MKDYIVKSFEDIVNIDSPTGFTKSVMELIEQKVRELGFDFRYTNKGNGVVSISGKDKSKTVGVCAHCDTLGLMVKFINADGTLKFTNIGGPLLSSYHGEYCTIHCKDGKKYTGLILTNSPSVHVYDDAKTKPCDNENMHIIIDEKVSSKEEVLALGIQNGDFIAIDPKFTYTKSGYIKSRFLDDKISVAILMGYLKDLKEKKILPKHNLEIIFSTYEEVGHGLSHVPNKIDELLIVDMGCVGKDLDCTEAQVSICAKDGSTPYDYDMVSRLISLAKENNLDYAVDVYTFYGSDASAALRGGHDIKSGLIGTGVLASHGMERTHIDGVMNTYELLKLYLN